MAHRHPLKEAFRRVDVAFDQFDFADFGFASNFELIVSRRRTDASGITNE